MGWAKCNEDNNDAIDERIYNHREIMFGNMMSQEKAFDGLQPANNPRRYSGYNFSYGGMFQATMGGIP